jgi:hypothetical protein
MNGSGLMAGDFRGSEDNAEARFSNRAAFLTVCRSRYDFIEKNRPLT